MITPGSFDHETSRQMVGDELAREIEAKARIDADQNNYMPPEILGETYYDRVIGNMRVVIYREQYTKRLARNQRKASR